MDGGKNTHTHALIKKYGLYLFINIWNKFKKFEFLSLKTLLFLHIQSDQIMASAPTLISIYNLWSTPLCQLPKILAILRSGYKAEPFSMIDHI